MSKVVSKVIFFIPARGGSKGIQEKNLQEIGNMSLVEIAVKTGIDLEHLISIPVEVVVSSNDSRILELAESLNVTLHHRPENLCQDNSTTEEALINFLEQDPLNRIKEGVVIGLMQCTSPFTSLEACRQAIDAIGVEGFDSAFLGIANHYWLYKWSEQEGTFLPQGHELGFRPSRQQVQEQIHETGAGYFFTSSEFMHSKFRIFGKAKGIPVSAVEGIDIDNQEDLDFARLVYNLRNTAG
ncbi:NeuA CMP-N-acetylneuraminic acid synthetase [Candidatus Nanopelagicaceae bacterium]